MFEEIGKESKQNQELFKKLLKYHFDWDPNGKSKNTMVKQVENWIVNSVKEAPKKTSK